MAFVRKYLNAGGVQLKKKFKWEDVGEYDADEILHDMASGFEDYLRTSGHDAKMQGLIRGEYNKIRNGILNGTLVKLANGKFYDTGDGGFTSNDGTVHLKKIFDWLNVGGVSSKNPAKDNRGAQNASGFALAYLNLVLHGIDERNKAKSVEKEPEIKKPKFNGEQAVKRGIGLTHFGGEDNYNSDSWFSGTYGKDEHERAKQLASIFSLYSNGDWYDKYDWSGTAYENKKDQWIADNNALVQALSSDKYDDADKIAANKLGYGDLSKFLVKPAVTPNNEEVSSGGGAGNGDAVTNPEYSPIEGTDYFYLLKDGKYSYFDKDKNPIESTPNGLVILPGNPLVSLENKYLYNGKLADLNALPGEMQSDLSNIDNGFTLIRSGVSPTGNSIIQMGYGYGRNLTPLVTGLGEGELLFLFTKDPNNPKGLLSLGLYKNGKLYHLGARLNNTLGGYDLSYIDQGRLFNAGNIDINPEGGVTGLSPYSFGNFTDYSNETNINSLYNTWKSNALELNNPASEIYQMVSATLDKWTTDTNAWQKKSGVYRLNTSQGGLSAFKDAHNKWNLRFTSTPSNKYGGVVSKVFKGLYGIKVIPMNTPQPLPEPAPVLNTTEAEDINNKVFQSWAGRSPISISSKENLKVVDAGGVIKGSDKARLGAAIADLVSTGLGFVPGANIASTGIGIGSSLTEFGADIADEGLTWGGAARLATNLGMDAVSLLPGMKAMKSASAFRKIMKAIPVISTAVNAANFLDPEIRKEYNVTLSKIANGDISKLDTGDFKNLSAISSLLLTGKNTVGSSLTTRKVTHSSTTSTPRTTEVTVKGKTIKVPVAAGEETKIEDIRKRAVDEYNKLGEGVDDFKKATIDDVDLTYTKFPFGKAKVVTEGGSKENTVTERVPLRWAKNHPILAEFIGPTGRPMGLDRYAANKASSWGMRGLIPAGYRQTLVNDALAARRREKAGWLIDGTGLEKSDSELLEFWSNHPRLRKIKRPLPSTKYPIYTNTRTGDKYYKKGLRYVQVIGKEGYTRPSDSNFYRFWNIIPLDKNGGQLIPMFLSSGQLRKLSEDEAQSLYDSTTELFRASAVRAEAETAARNQRLFGGNGSRGDFKITGLSNATSANNNWGKTSDYYADLYDENGKAIRDLTLNDILGALDDYQASGNIWKDVEAARKYYLENVKGSTVTGFRNWYNSNVDKLRENYQKTIQHLPYSNTRNKVVDGLNKLFQIMHPSYPMGYDNLQLGANGTGTLSRLTNSFRNDEEYASDRSGEFNEIEHYMDNAGKILYRLPKTSAKLNTDPTYKLKLPVSKKSEGLATELPIKTDAAGNPNTLPDLGKLAEMGVALGANARAAELYKSTPAMSVTPPLKQRLLEDGYTTIGMPANKIAADLRALGRELGNSSANLQANMAAMAEQNAKADNTLIDAAAKRALLFNTSQANVLETQDWNLQLRVNAANQNRQYLLAKQAADANVDASRVMADANQVIIPAIAEGRTERKLRLSKLGEVNYKSGLNNLSAQYTLPISQAQAKAEKEYEDYLKANPNATRADIATWQSTNPAYKNYLTLKNSFDNEMLDLQRKNIFKSGGRLFASGGTLSAADRARLERMKAFNKSLLDFAKRSMNSIHKSQDRTSKGIMQLGSHIADLRTKSLGFK